MQKNEDAVPMITFSLRHICFCVVKDKKDPATAGHFKTDKQLNKISSYYIIL